MNNQQLNTINVAIFRAQFGKALMSLIYSEYISCMKQKDVPVTRIMVPPVKYIDSILQQSEFKDRILEEVPALILEDPLMDIVLGRCGLVSYNMYMELFKDAFNRIYPSIADITVSKIRSKFLDERMNQLFVESSEIDIFKNRPITDDHYKYIAHETVLNLLHHFGCVSVYDIVEPDKIVINNDDIIIINHPQAMDAVIIDTIVLENSVWDLLQFVTSVFLKEIAEDGYHLYSNPYNIVKKYKIDK